MFRFKWNWTLRWTFEPDVSFAPRRATFTWITWIQSDHSDQIWGGQACSVITSQEDALFCFYNHNDPLKAQKNAQQIYFPQIDRYGFYRMIVIFYSTFIIIYLF